MTVLKGHEQSLLVHIRNLTSEHWLKPVAFVNSHKKGGMKWIAGFLTEVELTPQSYSRPDEAYKGVTAP